MFSVEFLIVLLLALAIEAVLGYPAKVYAMIGHPVTWIGWLISWMDARWNGAGASISARRATGVAAILVLVLVSVGIGFLLVSVAARLGLAGTLLLGILASTLLAQRSLHEHVERVASALETGGVAEGRKAIAMIVGRNPEALDEAAICRAAIESLAENFSDGIVAPAVWTAAAGLPGGVAYKAINTADSMIGHRTPRHEAFGWASARLDDLVNLPASRLTALLIVAACPLVGGSPGGAWRAIRRDAGKHRSPNAGWPEASMAGALGLRLNGPRIYGDTLVEDAWMGDGQPLATAADIRRALRLYRLACGGLWLLAALLLALMLALGR